MSSEVISILEARKNKEKEDKLWKRLSKGGNVYQNTRTGMLYVRAFFTAEGIRPLFKSLKTKKVGLANTRAKRMIQEWRNHHLGIKDLNPNTVSALRKGGIQVKQITAEILRDYTPTCRFQTRKQHKLYFKYINNRWGEDGINTITVEKFLDWMKEERIKRPRKTYSNYAKHVNILWNFAYSKKYTSHLLKFPNPDKLIRQELEEKPKSNLTALEKEILELQKSRCYTSDEIKQLWNVMNDELRDRFVLSLECFMRKSEVLKLEWDRVNLDTGLIVLRAQDVKTGSKTGKGRKFYASPHALDRLRKRFKKRIGDSPYVFPGRLSKLKPAATNQHLWEKAKREAKIKDPARWHDLRHTALTFAILGDPSQPEEIREKQKQDPMLVSEYAGVSMAVIQRVYLHTEAEHTRGVTRAFAVLELNNQCEPSVKVYRGKN